MFDFVYRNKLWIFVVVIAALDAFLITVVVNLWQNQNGKMYSCIGGLILGHPEMCAEG
jgi:hypothetical protein